MKLVSWSVKNHFQITFSECIVPIVVNSDKLNNTSNNLSARTTINYRQNLNKKWCCFFAAITLGKEIYGGVSAVFF